MKKLLLLLSLLVATIAVPRPAQAYVDYFYGETFTAGTWSQANGSVNGSITVGATPLALHAPNALVLSLTSPAETADSYLIAYRTLNADDVQHTREQPTSCGFGLALRAITNADYASGWVELRDPVTHQVFYSRNILILPGDGWIGFTGQVFSPCARKMQIRFCADKSNPNSKGVVFDDLIFNWRFGE